jgi:hypothetical protein
MTKILACTAFGLAVLAASQSGAQTQRLHFNPQSFDLWCQETQHLPSSRCDKRLPGDDAAYQAYVNQNENYEQKEQQQKQSDHRLNQTILRSDPSSNPAGTPPTAPITPPR